MNEVRLPIEDVLEDVVDALGHSGAAVLQAPPGAGKTTRVPLALLDAPWLDGQRIVMLEPRRIAARAAAGRLATHLNTSVGDLVGYRMRHDTKVSRRTRIEVVTEGVLTRMIQTDPSLDGVGVVVFDEFHERSLHADLALAFVLETRAALRPDLRLLIMSATLDGHRVSAALGDAPIITSEGRQYEVVTQYRPPLSGARMEQHMAEVISDLAAKTDGDILAFLPGAAWIRRTQQLLSPRLPEGFAITPLYGMLSPDEQDRAIHSDPRGRRKVVLSTDIAETSVTIEGVRVVVDGGQRRAPRFDPRSGLTRLQTTRISLASADQRRGRAGRLAPGSCYRLWAEREQQNMDRFDKPEIANADLSGLRLQLAAWGADATELTWLDQPPLAALAEATTLLESLDALDNSGRMTGHGKAMLDIGAEPRLAHMLVAARDLGLGATACDLAGLLSGRDPLTTRSVDLRERLSAMRSRGGPSARSGAMDQARKSARRWRKRLGVGNEPVDTDAAGTALALAFGDRVAMQRGAAGSYLMSSGRGAELPAGDALIGQEFLAIADVDGDPAGGRIYLAVPLDRGELEQALASQLSNHEVVRWDTRGQDVVAEVQTRLGALILKRKPIPNPPADALAVAWAEAVAAEGLALLPFSDEVEQWRSRVAFLRGAFGDEWPDLSDQALLETTAKWLAPHLVGVRRRRDLQRLDLKNILGSVLDWAKARRLDELAPTHVTVPSGNSIKLDYSNGEAPALAVRLQELFGLTESPTVADGRIPVVLHLLSPAQRPVQVTTDLASFWGGTYPQVKAELMGRYPKHHWPDDPLRAQATARTKKRPRR